MKKIIISLLCIFSVSLVFSQTGSSKAVGTGKIKLSPGQKIIAECTQTIEANLSMGMELNSSSTNENLLEVKKITDKNYTISSTLTKVKVNMTMMGQPVNYDSEKKEDTTSEIAKTFGDKLNKPVDIIIDNTTGMAVMDNKKDKKEDIDEENAMNDLLNIFAESSDDAAVSGAFELIPPGKSVGDNWSDSTISKDMKTVRTYTLKSVTGNDAAIQTDIITTATNKVDLQGMEMEFKSNTKTTGEIITDIITGQVKKKNTQSEITGSFQLMGQDVPISGKVNSTSTYQIAGTKQ